MREFGSLLRHNRNYRYAWIGQVVSEIGDHFNNIAVFSLALSASHSGLVVSGIMLSRAVAVILAGPLAGVALDRMDRKRLMVASDLIRAAASLCFLIAVRYPEPWLLYAISAALMFSSPFFTSGRASILPAIASPKELHTANSLTQTTQFTTLTVGAFLAGVVVSQFGYIWAFLLDASSFLFSAWAISRLRPPSVEQGFRAHRAALTETQVVRPWREYIDGLRYMKATPLLVGIAVVNIGWATGGGAAQILFSLFGELVFQRGAAGIGMIWSCAGVGLLVGAAFGHWFGKRASFGSYKLAITICYLIHGGAYIVFCQMRAFWLALIFIGFSRAAVGVSTVLNFSQLLRNVSNEFRGRVFSTIETLTWSVMMISMMGAGAASTAYDPRIIGTISGILSSTTALTWGWMNWSGRLPKPETSSVDPYTVEVHGEPTV